MIETPYRNAGAARRAARAAAAGDDALGQRRPDARRRIDAAATASRAGAPGRRRCRPTCRRCSRSSRAEATLSGLGRFRHLAAEQRGDLLLRLDVRREAARRPAPARCSHAGSAAVAGALVGLVEERIARARRLAPELRDAAPARLARLARGADSRSPALDSSSSRRARSRYGGRGGLVELERLELDLLLDQLLDVGDQARVVARDQRDRQARGAGAAGAADAVDVVLGVERHVEVEDRRQVDDVEAARGDVGRDQHVDLARLERLERLQPLVLRLVAVQRVGAQAVALERARQPGAAELGVDEDERLGDRALLQDLQHGAPLVVGRDAVEVLLDVGRGRVRPRHLDHDRVLQVAFGEAPDLGREGRREEQRLALLGQVREDALQVGQEADVEHAVGLVEDDVLDLVQHAVLRLDVVEQPPRRRDEHLDALLQLERLRLHVDAAEDDGDAQLRVRGVALDVVGDLVGELARRRDARARAPGWRAGDMLAFSCGSILCSSGSENAAVLPVPVCAAPMMSRPARTIGIAFAWIGVIVV